jgi:hypothetical protein
VGGPAGSAGARGTGTQPIAGLTPRPERPTPPPEPKRTQDPDWFRDRDAWAWEARRLSLQHTLTVKPECGPRLIAAGLWSGKLDTEGVPIPTAYVIAPNGSRASA